MDSDINIQLWAKTLGYEGVEEKTFRDSWRKLVPPSMKSTWRHVITHVLPAEKASYIRKHCLLYKLELQESIKKGIKLQADVKSVKEYEGYQQMNNLNVNHSYLNGQIDDVYNEIKQMWTKLETQWVKQNDIKEKDKEKLIKSKLLELKIKSTYEEIEKLKEMQAILDNIKSNSSVSYIENEEKWGKEITELSKKLPKSQELQKLSGKLELLNQMVVNVKVDNYGYEGRNGDKKNEILQEMKLIYIEKFLEAEKQRKNSDILKQKINQCKEKIVQKFVENIGDSQQVEPLNLIINSNIQKIVDQVKVKALNDLQNSWTVDKDNCKTEKYIQLQNEISLLDKQIESKLNEITASEHGQNKLIQFCSNAQKIIIDESKNTFTDIKIKHPQLVKEAVEDLSSLRNEIELFVLNPVLRNSTFHDSGPMSSNPAIYDCMSKLAKYDEVMSGLKFGPPHNILNAEEVISKIKNNELLAGIQLKSILEKIKEIAKDINKLKLASQDNLKFWKEQPLAEGSCSSGEDYAMWRKRLEWAVIGLHAEDDDTLDESSSVSFSYNDSAHILNAEED